MRNSGVRNLRERDIVKMLCEHFTEKGYLCSMFSLYDWKGQLFDFDLRCEKNGEELVVEVKVGPVRKGFIDNISLYMRFFPDTRFYLCTPSPENFHKGVSELLQQSGIGLILVKEGWDFETKTEARSHTDLQESLAKSIEKLTRPRLPLAKAERAREEKLTDLIAECQRRSQRLTKILTERSSPIKLRISKELLDYIGDLDNVSYSRELAKFEEKYRGVVSNEEEYQLVLETVKQLWAKYNKEAGMQAFESYLEFEPLLREIPGYRDHMIHPFQVFLMGSIIIDRFYDLFQDSYRRRLQNARKNSLDIAWLLCSTFHDFCYPIQMYESVNQRVFKKFLQIEEPSSLLQFQAEKILLQKWKLKLVDQLVSLYSHYTQLETEEEKWFFDSKCILDENFRFVIIQEIMNRKNHAPLSALALLNMILGESKEISKKYYKPSTSATVFPAALAIALHDRHVISNIPEPDTVSFEFMPIPLLLIYCDTAQEFGRVTLKENCILRSLNFEDTLVETRLVFSEKSVYQKKKEEIDAVFEKLTGDGVQFKLSLVFGGVEYSRVTPKLPEYLKA